MLIATKIGDLIGHWAAGAHVSPLLLGWSAAALVRIATGSATVATITGAGIAAPIIQADPSVNKELMVLATGSGSLILSHVNDAGFWLSERVLRVGSGGNIQVLDRNGDDIIGVRVGFYDVAGAHCPLGGCRFSVFANAIAVGRQALPPTSIGLQSLA
jgi:hypothetical protein